MEIIIRNNGKQWEIMGNVWKSRHHCDIQRQGNGYKILDWPPSVPLDDVINVTSSHADKILGWPPTKRHIHMSKPALYCYRNEKEKIWEGEAKLIR